MARGGPAMDGAPAWALALEARVRDLRKEVRQLRAELEQRIPDPLLNTREAAALVRIPWKSWCGYWRHFPALVEGFRPVRARDARSRGRHLWLASAVRKHIEIELRDGIRLAQPAEVAA